MYLRYTLFVILFSMSFAAQAFELIMIQAISESKKTFITRNGKRQGLQPGMTGTFTAENISILAKAINVTGNFTQWQVMNSDAIIPYEKGTIVTYYPATEYLWALAPESERKKYIKSHIPKNRRSWVFKGSLSRGLSESVSDAPANTPKRGGYMGEVYYEKGLYYNLAFDVGLRYEREVINYDGASFLTKRSLFIADLLYYFDSLRDYISGGKFYIGAGLGYGLSNTSTVGLSQSGPVAILPTVKAGVSLPFNDEWDFLFDGAFESLNTREEQEDGRIQTTTQTNFKVGFGLRRFF
jgi:opacity protein-like surface antigen